ncbi:MAG: Flp pilus assembly protein CpaB [Clostridiaceae bacterium]|jgi:pilus assembly protein CpaB|nr:Flp pilus assembly protein CpaB [Clostridiaceae bacterium]
MEKTNKKIIAIAVILSLITALLIYVYLSRSTVVVVPEIEYVTVYAAARTIPARTQISVSDIKQVNIAKELLNTNAVTDPDKITGKYTLQSIMEGELIRSERLGNEDSMYASYMVPEGTRAVSMNITEQTNVSNLVRPGDFVDLVVSFQEEDDAEGVIYPRITRMILQNVQVLALGQDVMLSSDKLDEPPATVTLAIKVQDVEKFVYASEFGIIRLALRPMGDDSVTGTQGTLRSDVTGNRGTYYKEPDEAE